MNTSPFASWQDFETSTQAMFAFADAPGVLAFLVILSLGVCFYWLYTTVSIPRKHEEDNAAG